MQMPADSLHHIEPNNNKSHLLLKKEGNIPQCTYYSVL